MKINIEDYEKMKQFIVCFLQFTPIPKDLPPEDHPIAILNRFEKKSLSLARKSLAMAISDSLEISNDWKGDVIKNFDEILKSNDAITLTELRKRYSRRFSQIIKAGKIRNEHDYYHVKGMLDSNTACFSQEEIINLTQLLNNYELKISSR